MESCTFTPTITITEPITGTPNQQQRTKGQQQHNNGLAVSHSNNNNNSNGLAATNVGLPVAAAPVSRRPQPTTHTPFAAPPLLPIDDFHLLENPNKYGEEERQLRIKVAAVYRLIELNGWAMGIYNHVTVSSIQCILRPTLLPINCEECLGKRLD